MENKQQWNILNYLKQKFVSNKPSDTDEYKNIVAELETANLTNSREFILPIKYGKVIKVYDGDTITIATLLPYDGYNTIFKFSVRLNGIDTPEMKGKNVSEKEKTAAKYVQKIVEELLLNKIVKLQNIQNEKYGRLLADVYLGENSINNLLLQMGYAVPYDGGTKKSSEKWFDYIIEKNKSNINYTFEQNNINL